MTTSQIKAIDYLREKTRKDLLFTDAFEIKKFEIEECTYFVSVYIETGLIGDEHTAAAIVARDTAHIFVGKRGGLTYPVWNRDKKTTERKTFHKITLLEVVCDQRI